MKLQGGNAFKSTDSTLDGVNWLKISNVGVDGIKWDSKSYLPYEFWDTNKSVQLFKDDYVMALTRPILNGKLKIAKLDTRALLNQRVAKLIFYSDSEFGFQMLKKYNVVKKLENELAGTDPPNLGSKILSNIKIYIPVKKEEQRYVGKTLNKIDSIITLHQRKINTLEEQKKAYLSMVFPRKDNNIPEIRFNGFKEEWEQRKLGDVSDVIGGGTPNTNNPAYWDGDIDWYSPAELKKDIYLDNSQRKITELGLKNSSAKILPRGTVLFTSRAGIGNTAILDKESATNQGFQSIVPKDNLLDTYFIYSKSHLLKRYGEINGAGSTFIEVSGKEMSKMPLLLPTIKEQIQIGRLLKSIDNNIVLHQSKLHTLKRIKQVYLTKMFI